MFHLVTVKLFMNNRAAEAVRRTFVLQDRCPIDWWESGEWAEREDGRQWAGCIVLNVYSKAYKL